MICVAVSVANPLHAADLLLFMEESQEFRASLQDLIQIDTKQVCESKLSGYGINVLASAVDKGYVLSLTAGFDLVLSRPRDGILQLLVLLQKSFTKSMMLVDSMQRLKFDGREISSFD